MIGEAFIAVRADTTAFSAQVASAASAAAGAAGTTASKTFTQSFATGATQLGKTMTRSVTLPLAGIGIAAGVTAANFETAFSKMSGLVGVSDADLKTFRSSVLDLAGETARSPQELAEALYFVTSAGQSGATAMETLRISARAAAAGLGETQVVADTITSAMAAYSPEVLSAARATDILVAGVKFGKAEADELAAGIGNLAPLASQLGVSFEDLTATISAMTVVGIDTDTAFTNVSAILSGLLKTTPQSERALEAVGLSSGQLRDTMAKPGGLVEALRQVDTAFGGNEEAMAQVFPNIRALRGVMGLLAQNGEEVDKVFRGVTNSTGSLDHAFDAASKTSAFKFKQGLADLQVEAIDLGNDLLPVGEKILGFVSAIVDGFGKLPDAAQNMVILGGGALAAVGPLARLAGAGASVVDQFTRSSSGLRSFGSFLGGGSFAGNVAKGGLAIGGFLLAAELVGPKLTDLVGSAELSHAALGALAGLSFGPWGAAVGGVLGGLYGHFFGVEDAAAAAEAAIKAFTGSLKAGDEGPFVLTLDEIKNTLDGLADGAGPRAANIMNELGFSMEDLTAAVNAGEGGLDAFRSRVLTAADAAGLSDERIGILNTTFDTFGRNLDVAREKQLAYASTGERMLITTDVFNQSLSQLNGALFAGAGSAEKGSQAYGILNGALTGTAGALAQAFTAQVAYTGSAEGAAAATAGQTQSFVDSVNQLTGGNIPQTANYIGTLLGIPAERFTNVQNTADIARVVTEFLIQTYGRVPGSKHTELSASGSTGPIDTWIEKLNAIPREVNVSLSARLGSVPFFQHGGVVHGGVGIFGERGPEIGVAPKGTRILTHGESMQAARDAMALSKARDSSASMAVSAPTIPGSIGLHGTGTLEAVTVELIRTIRRLDHTVGNLERDTRSGDGVSGFLDGRR